MSSKQPGTLKGSPSIKVIKSKRIFNDEEVKIIGRWIEEVVGENLDLNDLLISLRSGTKLCKLINHLQPGVVDESRILHDSSSSAFEENLKVYLAACFQLGVRSHELFTVDDILQNGDIQSVLRNVVAVNKAVVARGYAGPKLKISEQDENELERVWAELSSLKKSLQDCLEENKALRYENKEIKDYVAKQDGEVSKLKTKIQALERTQTEQAENNTRAFAELGNAPRAKPTSDGEQGEEGEDDAPAVVYVIKKKKKLGRENTERSPKLTGGLRSLTSTFLKPKNSAKSASKSSNAIYDDDEESNPRESSAVIELSETANPSQQSPGREASIVLVNQRKKPAARKKPTGRKGALANAKNDQVIFQSLSMLAF